MKKYGGAPLNVESLSWRVRRVVLGLRQRDVAVRVGISQAKYSLLERDEATPTTAERKTIDQVLRIPNPRKAADAEEEGATLK
jgi:transcriptional regulator with XRE-family HTH domain